MTGPWLSDLTDLVLGRACAGCEEPGPVLCARCLGGLRGRVRRVDGTWAPCPVSAATDYDGLARRLVLDYKERGNRALAPMLGVLLADAVLAHGDGLALVPVPAHRRARRGFDALGDVARHAQHELVRRRRPSALVPALLSVVPYRPLKSADRVERLARVRGALAVRSGLDLQGRRVVVVDDVVTTGATVAEAARVLGHAGAVVVGIATVCATSRDTWAPSRGPARTTFRP